MKRFFLLFSFFAIVLLAGAQTKVALKACINYATAKVLYVNTKLSSSYKPGFALGIEFNTPIENRLHFNPYIGYNMVGYKHKMNVTNISEYENTIHYFTLAPSFTYNFGKVKHYLSIGFGPYLAVALAGTEKTTSTVTGNTSSKMKFSTDGDYSRLDLGFNTNITYQINKIFIQAGYQIGLTNINNNVDIPINSTSIIPMDPRDIRNRVFSLSLGYFLK